MEQQELFSEQSLLRPYCLAIVTQDKPFGVNDIMFSPIERISQVNGPLDQAQENYSSSVESPLGGTNSQQVKGSQQTKATWIPNGDNHLFTSPMVRKNETVIIFKYADKDEFYWNTVFREPAIRRTERFIFAAGNLSGGTAPLDLDSIYFIDVNTIDKSITISTSLSDGEQYLYVFKFDPANKVAYINDNIGNIFAIDSEQKNVLLEDASGGKIETRDGHPRIFGPKGVLIETPAQFRVKSGNTLIEGPTVFKDTVDMKKTLALASGFNAGYEGGSGSEATFNGNMKIIGGLTVSGYAQFNGGHGPHND